MSERDEIGGGKVTGGSLKNVKEYDWKNVCKELNKGVKNKELKSIYLRSYKRNFKHNYSLGIYDFLNQYLGVLRK